MGKRDSTRRADAGRTGARPLGANSAGTTSDNAVGAGFPGFRSRTEGCAGKETLFPVVVDSRILIPAVSYVQGEILEARRPGKVKGTGEIRVRLNSMILPNGYAVDFNAIPTNAGTGGNESTDSEGKIHGDTDKGGDVGTVVKSTGIGAAIGAIAGQGAKGAGIGAGVGAAAGLAAVLLTRGPELELPRGTTVDVVLDRTVYLDASRVNFSDPGRASELPGPASREPTRSRSPF